MAPSGRMTLIVEFTTASTLDLADPVLPSANHVERYTLTVIKSPIGGTPTHSDRKRVADK